MASPVRPDNASTKHREAWSWPARAMQLSPAARYAIAVLAAAVAISVRLSLDPLWGVRFTLTMLFPAVALSAWTGGFGPGIVTTLLCAAAAQYSWIEPSGSFAAANPSEALGIALFVAVGAFISALHEAWRRTQARSERVAADLRHLQAITDTALSGLDSDSLIREWLSRVRTMLRCDAATMLLADPSGCYLTAVASVGLEEALDPNVRIPIGHGVAGRIAASGEPVIVDDLTKTEVISPAVRDRVKSLVGVPLRIGDRLVGVVHAGSATHRRFTQADAQLLSLIADRIAVPIERARLHEAERATRREAEKAKEQLQIALEAGRMGTWEYSLRTGSVKWSPGLEAIHGYAPGTFPGTFEAFRAEIHPEDRDRVLHAIADAGEQRRDHHIEYRIVRTDGATRWVEGRGQLFLDELQRPERMVGVCTDITERKQAEERFRMAVEAAPAAMLLVDERGCVVLANALTEELLNYGRDEIVGQPVERFVPARVRHEHSAHLGGFFRDPQRRRMGAGRDLHAVRRDGSEVPVEIGLSPIRTADGVFVLAAVTDITERKRAEALLRTRTEELERVLDVIPTAVWIAKDAACHEIIGNKSAAALFGLAEDSNFTVTPAGSQRAIPIRHFRDDRELAATELPMQRAAATGHPQLNQELDIELASGKRLTMLGGAMPLLDETGKVRGVVSSFSDITERKQMERQRADMLEREQTARAELDRASRLKDEFLAVLSHELRTPLNAVVGYAHLLRSGALQPDRATHALKAIERNAHAQARLVESLLDLSRIMAGKLELELEHLDLAKLIDSAVDVVRPEAQAKQIALHVSAPSAGLSLDGDAGRLQQVFWNLLSNAIKFTPQGGRISIHVARHGGEVTLKITDTGQGIPPDFLPYVFERFKQAETRKGRTPTGLGLGLALVREMVQAHGGRVTAESGGDGQGSTFTVMLPLSTARAAIPLRERSPESAGDSLARLNILIVDDDGDMRDLLSLLLEARNATVRAATSVVQALDAIAERRPDILLADVGMPAEDGYSLIRKVRVHERQHDLARLPAIAVTAYATANDRERALAEGYDGHVAKPVDPDALTRAIAAVAKLQEA